ncbi:hypothetical protein ABTL57_19010, partial [Acinetobacter baumannii]
MELLIGSDCPDSKIQSNKQTIQKSGFNNAARVKDNKEYQTDKTNSIVKLPITIMIKLNRSKYCF